MGLEMARYYKAKVPRVASNVVLFFCSHTQKLLPTRSPVTDVLIDIFAYAAFFLFFVSKCRKE
jgi:hypothetical protein